MLDADIGLEPGSPGYLLRVSTKSAYQWRRRWLSITGRAAFG